ncbi:MAG: hypothetical protein LBJ62_02565 [Bifidobacteriaceae bacterium]|jgi:hypothetical protein|nr:hypothetical protein [Bifidobacteriaceae bacterium]
MARLQSRHRTVLVIQDGSEIVRQPHADSEQYLTELVERSHLAAAGVQVAFASDVDAAHALAGITPAEYACVVFSSNALIRTQGPVVQAIENRANEIERYVAAGGGLVFLHQGFAASTQAIKSLSFIDGVTWESRTDYTRPVRAKAPDPEASLLRFPGSVELASLKENRDGSWQGGFPLFYTAMSLAPTCQMTPVLTSGHRTLLAVREHQLGRVALCALTADWARADTVLLNILTWVLEGPPQVLTVGPAGMDLLPDLRVALALVGAERSVAHVSFDGAHLTGHDSFLLRNARLCVIPGGEPAPAFLKQEEVTGLLDRGGAILGMDQPGGSGKQRMVVYLGSRSKAGLHLEILRHLVGLDLESWLADGLIFDARDAWLAGLQAKLDDDVHQVLQDARLALLARASGWLDHNDATKDPVTAMIAIWLARQADPTTTVGRDAAEALTDRVAPDARFVLAASHPETAHEAWTELRGHLAQPDLSVGSLIRTLDAFRMAQAGPEAFHWEPAEGVEVAGEIATRLLDTPPDGEVGWISVEATAAIVSGLACLIGQETLPESVALVMTHAARPLVRAHSNHDGTTSRDHVTALQIADALLAMEDVLPANILEAVTRLLADGSAPTTQERSENSRAVDVALQEARHQLVAERQARAELESALAQLRSGGTPNYRRAATLGRVLWTIGLAAAIGLMGVTAWFTVVSLGDPDSSGKAEAISALLAAALFLGGVVTGGMKMELVPGRPWTELPQPTSTKPLSRRTATKRKLANGRQGKDRPTAP